MLALLVGAVTLGAGLLRLGFVADLLSNPVRTGYLAGLAVVILVGQLPKLFGFSTDASGLVDEAVAFVEGIGQTNPWALGSGVLSLAIILGLKRVSPRTPGILVAVVVAIVAVDRARPGGPRRHRHRRPAPGLSGALRSRGAAGGHAVAVRRGGRASRWSPIGDTISDVRRLRGPRRLRGRRQPGARRDRVGQPGRGPLLGLPGEHQRVANRRRLPVGREDPADRARRGGPRDR